MSKSKGKYIIIMVVMLLLCVINTLIAIEENPEAYGEEDSIERFFVGASPVPTTNMNSFVSQNINLSNNSPSMTVLTHDIGGTAANWSNDSQGNFTIDKESLIEQFATSMDPILAVQNL